MIVTDVFDQEAAYYANDRAINVAYLRIVLGYLHELYRATGRLSLNEARRIIGIPTTGAGDILGWLYPRDPFPIVYLNEDIVVDHDSSKLEIVYDVEPIARQLE